VYFQNQTKEDDIFKIRDEMSASGKTQSIKYVSKQDALKIYRELNKSNPLLLEMVTADILPASLEVFASKPEYLTEFAAYLNKQPGVDEVVFQKDIVEKLLSLTKTMRRLSLFIMLFLLVVAFIVLMTTTAFKIALKKDEIELLRLLGGSTAYIRRPFLLEGVMFGVASGTLAFALFYLIFLYFYPFLSSYLSGIPSLSFYNLGSINLYVWPPSFFFIVTTYVVVVLFGTLIGFVGNYFSTSKYIK
jgi:cell division transport system permease protein